MNDRPTSVEPAQLQRALEEAHHRVRNTLQNVISYVNIMFGNREVVSRDEIKKLLNYLNGVSVIHDLLLEAVKNSRFEKQVRLDRIITDMVEISAVGNPHTMSYVPPMLSSPRSAGTVALIISELFDNALRHGEGPTEISVELVEPNSAALRFRNRLKRDRTGTPHDDKGNGLKLCELLTRAEFKTIPTIGSDKENFQITVTFPVSAIDSEEA